MNRSVGILLALCLVSCCVTGVSAAAKKEKGKAPAAPAPSKPTVHTTVPVGATIDFKGGPTLVTDAGLVGLNTGKVAVPVGGGPAPAPAKGKKKGAAPPAAPTGPSYNPADGKLIGVPSVTKLESYGELKGATIILADELNTANKQVQDANEQVADKQAEIEQGLNPLGSKGGNIAMFAAAIAGAAVIASVAFGVIGHKIGKAKAREELAAQYAEDAQVEQLERDASAMGHVVSAAEAAKSRVPTEAVVADLASEMAKDSRRSRTTTSDVKSGIVSAAVKEAVVKAAVRSAVASRSSRSKSASNGRL